MFFLNVFSFTTCKKVCLRRHLTLPLQKKNNMSNNLVKDLPLEIIRCKINFDDKVVIMLSGGC